MGPVESSPDGHHDESLILKNSINDWKAEILKKASYKQCELFIYLFQGTNPLQEGRYSMC